MVSAVWRMAAWYKHSGADLVVLARRSPSSGVRSGSVEDDEIGGKSDRERGLHRRRRALMKAGCFDLVRGPVLVVC